MRFEKLVLCLLIAGTTGCPDEPTLQDALAAIDRFQAAAASAAGATAIPIAAFEGSALGEVRTVVQCPDGPRVLSRQENALKRFDDIETVEDPDDDWESVSFEWRRDFDHSAKIDLKLVRAAVDTTFTVGGGISRAETLVVNLEIKDVKRLQVLQPVDLLDQYSNLLALDQRKARGNSMITELYQGRVRFEYMLLDESEQEIDIELPNAINEVLGVGYTMTASQGAQLGVVQESMGSESIFAINVQDLPMADQDLSVIQAEIDKQTDCGSVGGIGTVRHIVLFDPISGESLLDVGLEEGGTADRLRYFVQVKNISGTKIDDLGATIAVRGPYGRLINQKALMITRASPLPVDGVRDMGFVVAIQLPPLAEAGLDVTLTQ